MDKDQWIMVTVAKNKWIEEKMKFLEQSAKPFCKESFVADLRQSFEEAIRYGESLSNKVMIMNNEVEGNI